MVKYRTLPKTYDEIGGILSIVRKSFKTRDFIVNICERTTDGVLKLEVRT